MKKTMEQTLRSVSLPGLSLEAKERLLDELRFPEPVEVRSVPFKREKFSLAPAAVSIFSGLALLALIFVFYQVLSSPDSVNQNSAAKKSKTQQAESSANSKKLKTQSLRTRSLPLNVQLAQVIVTGVVSDYELAPAKSIGDAPEYYITFEVTEVLKGTFSKEECVIRTPSDPQGYLEKEWIVMLSPEYVAGRHRFGGVHSIKQEARVREILGLLP